MSITQRLAAAHLAVLMLAGCMGPGLVERRVASTKVATDAGWRPLRLDGGPFVLSAFAPAQLSQADTLTLYIEGDGLAWIDAVTPSFDPTPLDPLALRLALRQPSGPAVYLARPCQYVAAADWRICERKYWTSHRFAPVVIEASNQAVEQLKRRFGARRLVLVGYSGGAAVAALLAARRQDVERLVTVAGNLDHRAWTTLDRLSPLSGSLNPADELRRLAPVPQFHFVGELDRTVPKAVADAYSARFPAGAIAPIRVVEGFDHSCCWVREWPSLYLEAIRTR